jgi:hypothetical protein
MNTAWSPNYLAKWLFAQKRVWIAADGREIEIASMDAEHALNTLLMIERVNDDICKATGLTRERLLQTKLYGALRDRVAETHAPKAEPIVPDPEQPGSFQELIDLLFERPKRAPRHPLAAGQPCPKGRMCNHPDGLLRDIPCLKTTCPLKARGSRSFDDMGPLA